MNSAPPKAGFYLHSSTLCAITKKEPIQHCGGGYADNGGPKNIY